MLSREEIDPALLRRNVLVRRRWQLRSDGVSLPIAFDGEIRRQRPGMADALEIGAEVHKEGLGAGVVSRES